MIRTGPSKNRGVEVSLVEGKAVVLLAEGLKDSSMNLEAKTEVVNLLFEHLNEKGQEYVNWSGKSLAGIHSALELLHRRRVSHMNEYDTDPVLDLECAFRAIERADGEGTLASTFAKMVIHEVKKFKRELDDKGELLGPLVKTARKEGTPAWSRGVRMAAQVPLALSKSDFPVRTTKAAELANGAPSPAVNVSAEEFVAIMTPKGKQTLEERLAEAEKISRTNPSDAIEALEKVMEEVTGGGALWNRANSLSLRISDRAIRDERI